MNFIINKIAYKKELLFLLTIHAVGVAGIKWINTDLFLQLSFVCLVIPLAIIINKMKLGFKDPFKNYLLLISVYLIGFFSEWLGVNGGYIFGDYLYGQSLGLKFAGVPLLIGANWLLLSLASREVVGRFFQSPFFVVVVSALVMVGIDYIIEPVAPKLDFWSWSGGSIPFSNYRDWFAVSVINQLVLLNIRPQKKIFSLALGYLAILVGFFLCFY